MKRSMLETLVGSTRLLSFPKGFSCFESDVEEIAKCQDNSLGGHVYYDENEMSDADSIALEEEPESNAMMFFNTFYSADFVITKTTIKRECILVVLGFLSLSSTKKYLDKPRGSTTGSNFGKLQNLSPNCYPPAFAKPRRNFKTKYLRRRERNSST